MTNHPNRSLAAAIRRARKHITDAGYSLGDASSGIDYATAQGATEAREIYILAVSRILYTDEQLADGARFSVADGYGPQ